MDRNGNPLRVADRVRVIGFHPGIRDDGEFGTKTILKKAVGCVFPVVGFHKDWIELALGELVGKECWEETIWLEPEFVEIVKRNGKTLSRSDKTRNKRKRMLK